MANKSAAAVEGEDWWLGLVAPDEGRGWDRELLVERMCRSRKNGERAPGPATLALLSKNFDVVWSIKCIAERSFKDGSCN